VAEVVRLTVEVQHLKIKSLRSFLGRGSKNYKHKKISDPKESLIFCF